MAAPIVTNTYVQPTVVTFTTTTPITAIDGTVVDPDRVWFGFIINGQSNQAYTFHYDNGIGDTTGTIVRLGVGVYQASIDTSAYAPGVWVYSFETQPVESIGLDYTKTQVRVEDSIIVETPSFTFSL